MIFCSGFEINVGREGMNYKEGGEWLEIFSFEQI
jgi:hypothetical protein